MLNACPHSALPSPAGTTRRALCAGAAVWLLAAASVLPAAAQLLRCDDTRYHDGQPPDLFTSRYHLLQVYGDAAARSTNFFANAYDGMVVDLELRLAAPRLSEMVPGPVVLPDPVVSVSIKSLTALDWEDRADVGAGLEWRPLKRADLAGLLTWLQHVRLYAAYYRTTYFQDREEWSWRPRADARIGAELYRECNLYAGDVGPESMLWVEVWADASWRRTNFVDEDFRSWTLAIVPRLGVRLFPGREWAVMPYATGELATTQRSEPWQNRVLAGAGVRVMPFRWHRGVAGDLLRGGRLYVEHLWVIDYLGNASADGTPTRDLRVGITLVFNRWH